jgi:hypothetical protein
MRGFFMSGLRAKSNDTLILESRLRETSPGDVVTYDELSTLLGRDVREFCRGCLDTARNTLQAESIFFDTIPNEGFKRLDHDEACQAAKDYTTRILRTSRRGLRHLSNVPYDKLQPETQREHLVLATQLGAVNLFASGKSAKKIEGAVSGSQPLAIGETLKLFGVK